MERQINVRVSQEMKKALEKLALANSEPGKNMVKVSDVVRAIIERSKEYKEAAKEPNT